MYDYRMDEQEAQELLRVCLSEIGVDKPVADRLLKSLGKRGYWIQWTGYGVWNKDRNQDEVCYNCGHRYYRHFDTYDNMCAVGCKYCSCDTFIGEDEIVNLQGGS